MSPTMKRVWIGLVHLWPEPGCTLISENSFAQAVAFVTDEVKKRLPIFGREILAEGGHVWKQNV